MKRGFRVYFNRVSFFIAVGILLIVSMLFCHPILNVFLIGGGIMCILYGVSICEERKYDVYERLFSIKAKRIINCLFEG